MRVFFYQLFGAIFGTSFASFSRFCAVIKIRYKSLFVLPLVAPGWRTKVRYSSLTSQAIYFLHSFPFWKERRRTYWGYAFESRPSNIIVQVRNNQRERPRFFLVVLLPLTRFSLSLPLSLPLSLFLSFFLFSSCYLFVCYPGILAFPLRPQRARSPLRAPPVH